VAEKVISVEEAYRLALEGNQLGLEILSSYANGNDVDVRARKFIHDIEDREIIFGEEEHPPAGKRSNLIDILRHPITSIRTKMRQLEVSCDLAGAPSGSTQEDFPDLSLKDASDLLRNNSRRVR